MQASVSRVSLTDVYRERPPTERTHTPPIVSLTFSVVTVIEIGTETAVFRRNRTETEVLCLSVGGFENGAALVSTVR